MKLAILIFLFSIIVFSDAFGIDDGYVSTEQIAKRQFSLLNVAVATKDKKLIRELYNLKPDTDAKADEIIAEYQYYQLEVKSANRTTWNYIRAAVSLQPKLVCGEKKSKNFGLYKQRQSLTGWKIIAKYFFD